MNRVLTLALIVFGALLFSACPPAGETGNTEGNSAEPEMTTEATLAARDKEFSEAWMNKDGKFFEANLTDNFVGVMSGGRADKAMVVKFIADNKCEIKKVGTTGGKVIEIADGVALHAGNSDNDETCDGKKMPNGQFATLFVKDGDVWKAAYHQSRDMKPEEGDKAEGEDKAEGDADAAKEEGAEAEKAEGEEAKKEEGAEKKEEAAAPMEPNISSDDAVAEELQKLETGLWEAWAKKDTKPFENVLADNFMEWGDEGMLDRAGTMKQIAEHKCEVTSSSLSDAKATKVADNVYVFTYTGKAAGTCDGQAMPDIPMYTTTIFMKDGDNWKAVFHMGTPGMAPEA